MTDRCVTVPDSLELPAAVKVGVDRLHDSTMAGRALLTGADAAAQRTSLGLGDAAQHAHGDYATAEQGAKADASDVDQITLTGDLVLTIPEGHPAGQVYRCAITQPAEAPTGFTVTYGGQPVAVDLTAGAVTTVELHPAGAGFVVRYPSVANLASLSSTYAGRGIATRVLSSTAGMQARAENALTPQVTPTADGSGQTVHPSVVYIPEGWNGYRYWMAVTGYKNGDNAYENPHILACNDGQTWEAPPGLTNPIYPKPVGGYNSDTEMVIVNDTAYCYFRRTVGVVSDDIMLTTSTDGVTWTPATAVIVGTVGVTVYISPTVIYDHATATWIMWAVESAANPNVVTRLTAPAASGPWTGATACTGFERIAALGRVVWHIHVHPYGEELVMFFADAAGDGQAGRIRRAVSTDGLAWTMDANLTMVGNNPGTGTATKWDAGLYRPCAIPAQINGRQGWVMWYGGVVGSVWRTGRANVELVDNNDTSSIMAAACGIRPWLMGDIMDRADDAASVGVSSSGHTYTTTIGTMGIQNRAIYLPASANSNAVVNVGVADVDASVIMSGIHGSSQLVVRGGNTPHTTFIRFGPNSTLQSWVLTKMDLVNGLTATVVGGGGSVVSGSAPAAGDEVRVIAKGSRIRCFVNGLKLWDVTIDDAGLQSGTKVGVQAENVAAKFKALKVKPAP